MIAVASAVYRLALSLWVGGTALFTFVVTPVIFRTQGREAAGKIVGAIFPHYFRYGVVVAVAALAARIVSGEAFRGGRQWAGTLLIVTALLFTGYHAFVLGPRMAQIKQTAAYAEAASPDAPARREFMRLHGISMAVNLIVLLEGAALVAAYDMFRK